MCETSPSRRREDRRRTCRVGRGAVVAPPALVSPATALRVGGGGGKGTRARAPAPPPALARPAAGVWGGERRCRGAAGVGFAGGGSACWGGRRERDACTCLCSAAGGVKTGDGRIRWGGALSWRRRRGYRRRRLCALAGAACQGDGHVLLLRRRRWQDRRRTCRAARAAGVSPPASVAGGGSACWGGRRARYACTCFGFAAGVGETGGGRVERGWAQVCCRRHL